MPQPLPTTHLGVCFLSVVPAPELLDKVVVAGTPIQVTDRLLALKDAGLRWPLLYQVLGSDRAAAVKLIAQKVRPAFLAG